MNITETTKMVSNYRDDPSYQSSIPVVVTHFDDNDDKGPSSFEPGERSGWKKYGTLNQFMTMFVVVLVIVVMVSTGTDKTNKTYWVDKNPDGLNTANVQWTDRFGTVHTKTWTTKKPATTMSVSNSGRWWVSTNADGTKVGNYEWKDHLGNTHTKTWSTSKSLAATSSITNSWWNGWTNKDYADFWATHDDADAKTTESSHEFWEETDENGVTTFHVEWTDRFGIVHEQNWNTSTSADDDTKADDTDVDTDKDTDVDAVAPDTAVETP